MNFPVNAVSAGERTLRGSRLAWHNAICFFRRVRDPAQPGFSRLALGPSPSWNRSSLVAGAQRMLAGTGDSGENVSRRGTIRVADKRR